MNRRAFLTLAAGTAASGPTRGSRAWGPASAIVSSDVIEAAVQRPAARPRSSEFVFARLRYDSGDWDYNPKVAANVLNSIVE